MRGDRFQLSNLQKHLRVANKKSSSFISNDDQENSNQIDIDSEISRNESTHSTTQSTFNNSLYVDTDGIDESTSSTSTVKNRKLLNVFSSGYSVLRFSDNM